jgi:lamin tail-like protein/cohesin domain-containing protein
MVRLLFVRRAKFISLKTEIMERLKKQFVLMVLVVLALQLVVVRVSVASALGSVAINEVAWAGRADSANDEWIELYNNTSGTIDLIGWYIEDDGGASVYTIESGTIDGYGYFLIEDAENAVSNVDADALIGLSFANTGDSLVLKDDGGATIDTVNSSGKMWPAGDGASKATMERADPSVGGNDASNWASASIGNGSVSSGGSEILGTPGSANSNYVGGVQVSVLLSDDRLTVGETLIVSVEVESVDDLYAYGFDLDYDSSLLNFVSASEGGFLDGDGAGTSFNAELENGNEGTLVVGSARMTSPPSGAQGSGALFSVDFVVAGEGDGSVVFGSGSFMSDVNGDLPVSFGGGSFSVGGVVELNPVTSGMAEGGDSRYSLELSWEAPQSGADSYIVKKVMPDGSLATLTETQWLSFIDSDLIPSINYEYQIIAVMDGQYSLPFSLIGMETRGLLGDNDKSDRVDGRDLENLARAYSSVYGGDRYDGLVDTNYDGVIDGSDLIDIGANFALTY